MRILLSNPSYVCRVAAFDCFCEVDAGFNGGAVLHAVRVAARYAFTCTAKATERTAAGLCVEVSAVMDALVGFTYLLAVHYNCTFAVAEAKHIRLLEPLNAELHFSCD